jgi:hypothetical protein
MEANTTKIGQPKKRPPKNHSPNSFQMNCPQIHLKTLKIYKQFLLLRWKGKKDENKILPSQACEPNLVNHIKILIN